MLKEESIKNYLQRLLQNSKDFNIALSRLSNQDIKNIRESFMKRNINLDRLILGELITTKKIIFENNYREHEVILMKFWTTFRNRLKSMNFCFFQIE